MNVTYQNGLKDTVYQNICVNSAFPIPRKLFGLCPGDSVAVDLGNPDAAITWND